MVLLALRDVRAHQINAHWRAELGYLLSDEHILGLSLQLEDINEPFREYAKRRVEPVYSRKVKDSRGVRYFHKLYLELKRENSLPPKERHLDDGGETSKQLLERLNLPYKDNDLDFA
ncbi:uncharacterized protein BDV14DRAFT_199314 [Aspergillus stella-maris]|uniref:uncharacterized protein n=1 Tax=Aspergillus stella-maris TaxID=1810926 RepID=UPI003CCCC74F